MPSFGDIGSNDWKRARAAKVTAKLKKLGIDPRSNKYQTLWFRMMR